jgi:hypothetical protein
MSDGQVYSAITAYRDASDRLVKAVKTRFPTGQVVHWMRSGYQQRGEVNSVLGFEGHNLRLRVLNTKTGKFVDLHLYEIEEASR